MRLNNQTELETDVMMLIKKLLTSDYEVEEEVNADGEDLIRIKFESGLIMQLDDLPRNFLYKKQK